MSYLYMYYIILYTDTCQLQVACQHELDSALELLHNGLSP